MGRQGARGSNPSEKQGSNQPQLSASVIPHRRCCCEHTDSPAPNHRREMFCRRAWQRVGPLAQRALKPASRNGEFRPQKGEKKKSEEVKKRVFLVSSKKKCSEMHFESVFLHV